MEETKRIELKACPFCGSANVRIESQEPLFWAMCGKCFAITHPVTQVGAAAALWNQRAWEPPHKIKV